MVNQGRVRYAEVHDHNGIAGGQHKPVTDTGEASDAFQQTQTLDICRPGEHLPATAQTAPFADGEILGSFHLLVGGGASVVDPLPGNTPAAIEATRRSLSGHEPPPEKRRTSPSPSLWSWGRGSRNACKGFKGGERRDMPASHSFLVPGV